MPVIFDTVGLSVAANAAPLGQTAAIPGGASGELLMAELHGKYYSASRAGNVFMLATVAAGTIVPVQATNLVSTFTLWNPIGSGKNIELIRYSLGLTTTVTVVSDISIYFQSGVGNTVTAPGTLTLLPIRNTNLGSTGITSVCTGYSAATLVNVTGTNFFRGPGMTTFGAVTTTNATPINHDFDGTFILPPGSLITTSGTAAQTAAMTQTLTWAEWPV